jgi:hypothetical protein
VTHQADVAMAGFLLFFMGAVCCAVGGGLAYEASSALAKHGGRALVGLGIFLLSLPMIRIVSFFITG